MVGRLLRWCALLVVALLTTAPAANAAAGARPAPADDETLVNVVIVRAPDQNGGVPDTLVDIAGRTLGDEGRAEEIFELNVGRSQAEGSVVADPQDLRPGWVLLLPADARGPDVRLAVLQADGLLTTVSTDDDSWIAKRLRWPFVLTIAGGVVVAVLTVGLVARRRIRSRFRLTTEAVRRLRDVLRARRARRAALRHRAVLLGRWRGDSSAALIARAAAGSLPSPVPGGHGPLAVTVGGTTVTAMGVGAADVAEPWTAGPASRTWTRPLTGMTPLESPRAALARIGGTADEQVFVDLTQCAGVLSIEGDRVLAVELARVVVGDLGAYSGMQVLSLGGSGSPRAVEVPLSGLGGFGLPAAAPDEARTSHGLVVSTLAAPALGGVLLVEDARHRYELADLARRCAESEGRWVAVVVGAVDGAHWRWHVDRDGSLEVAMLDRRIVAAG